MGVLLASARFVDIGPQYSVVRVRCGPSALRALTEQEWDALVIDIRLPGLSPELVISRSEVSCPIVWLNRPINRVVTQLNRAVGGLSVPWEILTPTEAQLLRRLIEHRHMVVSKRSLAWPGIRANTVEVYVSYLRRKLPELPLETVVGRGYVLH